MNGVQVELRHTLHRHPELSNEETGTAERIRDFLLAYSPDRIVTGLGGTGLAAIYDGGSPGPCLLFRAELDGLPIEEGGAVDPACGYLSENSGVSHKCGHDGHMAIVAGLAPHIHARRPARGRVALLFQPAEETGEGAARVLDSAEFRAIAPDQVYALHNLPGFPLGTVVLRDGVFAAGSKGMVVRLLGTTSHAGEPEKGRCPALAMAELVMALAERVPGEDAFATVIHARLGERAFGVTPGFAEVLATLRSPDAELLARLSERSITAVQGISARHGIPAEIGWAEEFSVTRNSENCVARVRSAARSAGASVVFPAEPFRWSEDFGRFTDIYEGALFGLGAGEQQPALHRPEYDFPDALLARGTQIRLRVARGELG